MQHLLEFYQGHPSGCGEFIAFQYREFFLTEIHPSNSALPPPSKPLHEERLESQAQRSQWTPLQTVAWKRRELSFESRLMVRVVSHIGPMFLVVYMNRFDHI
jgi:hypothetical protein